MSPSGVGGEGEGAGVFAAFIQEAYSLLVALQWLPTTMSTPSVKGLNDNDLIIAVCGNITKNLERIYQMKWKMHGALDNSCTCWRSKRTSDNVTWG